MASRTAKFAIRRLLRRTGYDLIRFRGDLEVFQTQLFVEKGIALLLDVGANEGQYSQRMRQLGYRGDIVAFEPIASLCVDLQTNFRDDRCLSVRNAAVGDFDGEMALHVSANTMSSSLLPMARLHEEADPGSRYVREDIVEVIRLDSLRFPEVPTWLKIDVQGAELAVLAGASRLLGQVRVVQLELSLVPLYENGALIEEVLSVLRSARFEPVFIDHGFQDPRDGRMLQAEGVFLKVDDG